MSGRIYLKERIETQLMLTIIGGGLAGSEAAWQVAEKGIDVALFEMRPFSMTDAHKTGNLGELVCSNSLGSNLIDRASGLLKAELRMLDSLLISCADASSLPAGGALAVDRELFSECIKNKLERHPHIKIFREEVRRMPSPPAIIATGPLTSPALSKALIEFTGEKSLFFYDAIAPIIHYDSINMDIVYRSNRYDNGSSELGDYLNCPLDEESYHRFRQALLDAKKIPLKPYERDIFAGVDAGAGHFFQGCQPIEIIAEHGERSMAFGPMRPVGLTDPRTGRWPFAVVQLRQDNLAGDLYNLVGFQTNLLFSEQERVFRMIPGLENATFERFGQMHRNAFIASPKLLDDSLAFKEKPGIFVAGQLAGIEGYAGNIAMGLVTGLNAVRYLQDLPPVVFPQTTMIGALVHYITHAGYEDFQPIKAMFGILPKLDDQRHYPKRERYKKYSDRAIKDLENWKMMNSHKEQFLV
jgi:methylenetetrahydrofolate--tRNA-(uracil-5-)-methyltransferase